MIDQEEEMGRRWSDLPVDILNLFLDRLYFDDRDRFAAVCKPWFSAVARHRSPPIPLLLLRDSNDRESMLLLSPAEDGKIHRLKIPRRRWYASSHGWLFMEKDILFNPFTKEQIELPRSSAPAGDRKFLTAASMSSVAATVGEGMFAAFRDDNSELAFCRLGDKTWSDHFCDFDFLDLLFHEDLLYCIDSRARLFVLELGANPKIKELYHPTLSHCPPLEFVSLVLCGEELLMVVRSGEISPTIRTTLGFDVFRLSASRTEWVPTKNLDGWTLFLCHGSSLALEASKYPALKPNCIFYSDIMGCYLFFMEDGSFQTYRRFGEHILSSSDWLLYNAA